MKKVYILFVLYLFVFTSPLSAQQTNKEYPQLAPEIYKLSESVERISKDLTILAKSNESLNQALKKFVETFSSNQGLQLTERQQKLLVAFEFMNRYEQRLATLIKLKLDLIERQSAVRIQFATVTDDLLPESVDRYVAFRGTTNAEQLRNIRKQILNREKVELSTVITEIQRSLQDTNNEIRQIEKILSISRQRIFPEMEKELLNF